MLWGVKTRAGKSSEIHTTVGKRSESQSPEPEKLTRIAAVLPLYA